MTITVLSYFIFIFIGHWTGQYALRWPQHPSHVAGVSYLFYECVSVR